MKNRIPLFLMLFILSCQSNTRQSEDVVAEETVDATTLDSSSDAAEALSKDDYSVAFDFLNAYIENYNDFENRLSYSEWANASPLVTENFKTELQNLITEAEEEDPELGLDYDPITNSQEYPEDGMVLVDFDPPSGYVITQGKSWTNFIVIVKLVKVNGKVMVDGCGAINIPKEMREY